KQVATFAGNAKAYRAVGQILKRNPDNTKIPCHRVIRSDLQLSGYAFGGKDVQKKKLESEGLIFKAYTVVEKEPMQKPKRQKK
ncbi:MAG: MGMT family protein, partial [Candidatus Woesearchaeota archaeon]